MGCDCSRVGQGATQANPIRLGDPNGVVLLVDVRIPFAGMFRGDTWVTGSAVQDWISKGFMQLI